MAKAMNVLDVVKILLLDGGRVVERCPAVMGRTTYEVQVPHDMIQGAYKCVGHITEKQFSDLRQRGIMSYTGESGQDKYGTISNRYYLTTKEN